MNSLKKSKIAIHHRSGSFSNEWIIICKDRKIDYKIVNCYSDQIIDELEDCYALLWHYHHGDMKDDIMAKHLLFALEHAGIKCFPNFNTGWHFDSKLAQKYLFEALNLKPINTHVFYTESSALDWLKNTSFPKVFKLSVGAGSSNVKKVENYSQGYKLIKKSFGKGFKQFDGWANFKDQFIKYMYGKLKFIDLINAFGRIFINTEFGKFKSNEKGYAYFQDYVPKNDCDYRVIVIDSKAFAIKRMVRNSDFRASGSGVILYGQEYFTNELIERAFEVTKKINSQCCAMDFIYENDDILLIEVSFGFSMKGYEDCDGYWDEELNYHKCQFNPYEWMLDTVIKNS